MITMQANDAPSTDVPSTPEGRGASFVPVQGSEQMSGGGELVVAAYALVWALTLVWLLSMWRKQSALKARVNQLESQMERAMTTVEKI